MEARYGKNLTAKDRAVPNGAGLPPWPQLDPSKFDLMLFGSDGQVTMQPDPWRERLALVERVMDAKGFADTSSNAR